MRTFRGLPPTGRRIDMPLVAIFVFDGPDLLCERVYWDRLTLFIQLGVARDQNTPSWQACDSAQPPGDAHSRGFAVA